MNSTKYFLVLVALMSIPVVTYIKSACAYEDLFRVRALSSYNGNCNWERGNGRCNTDSDCCPGRECNAFSFCQACR